MASHNIAQNLRDNNTNWQNVKQAIEDMGVSTSGLTTNEYDDAIRQISGDEPVLDTLNVTPAITSQTITPPVGTDGYDEVNVAAVDNTIDANIIAGNIKSGVTILGVNGTYSGESSALEEVTQEPDFSNGNQTITPSSGYDGISRVNLTKPSTLIASNIKKDVTVAGIIGTYEGSGGQLPAVTNLSYLFYNNARAPKTFWGLFVDPNAENCTNFSYMCAGATLEADDYYLDLSNITGVDGFSNIFNYVQASGIVNLVIKLASGLISLNALFNGAKFNNINSYINLSFEGDGSGIRALTYSFSSIFGTLDLTEIKDNAFTTLANAFSNCNVLTNLIGLSDIDITHVTELTYMFKYFNYYIGINGSYNTLDLSAWDFSNIINMGYMFYGAKIQHIKFNGNHTFTNIRLSHLCDSCSELLDVTGLEIQETAQNSANSRTHEFAFGRCSKLTSIISTNKWIIHSGAYQMFQYCELLTTIPEIDIIIHNASYRDTIEAMFYNCYNIEEITINLSYADASPHAMYCVSAFYNCRKLKEIKGDLNLSYICSTGQLTSLFAGCVLLEKIATTGGIAENLSSAVTLDLSDSPVFDIADYISNLATKVTTQTRNIKLNATVYSALTQATIDAATAKGYTLISA